MTRRLLAMGLFSITCYSQIRPDMATTADGRQMFFSTVLRLKGSSETGFVKIFKYASSGSGFSLYRQLNLISRPGLQANFYQAERPSVSADGNTVAYTATSSCNGGSACLFYEYYQGEISTGGLDSVLGGLLTVSPDGAFALSVKTGSSDYTPELYRLADGTSALLTGYRMMGAEKQAVANGGAVLVNGSDGPAIWRGGGVQELSIFTRVFNAGLSADASTVVYEAHVGAAYQLHSYAVSSGIDVTLATSAALYPGSSGEPPLFFDPCVSGDGSSVTYLRDGQLWVEQTNGTGARQLTSLTENVTAQVLSGSGAVGYAATASSRILKIDVASGVAKELSAPTPHLAIVGGATVPGAVIEVSVANAAGGDDPALEGVAAPIVARSSQFTTLQIPWEQMAGAVLSLVASVNPSQFEEAQSLTLQAAIPGFLDSGLQVSPSGFPYALAVHQNFGGQVTEARPAAAGEIISVYMTGLGQVAPGIGTGVVTPASPLYRVQTAFACSWDTRPTAMPASILFAGLAPGSIGIEQVNVVVPTVSVGVTNLVLECESQEPIGEIGGFAAIPVGVTGGHPHPAR